LPARFWGKRIACKTLSFGPIRQTPEFKDAGQGGTNSPLGRF
jgi:hypothetical protein